MQPACWIYCWAKLADGRRRDERNSLIMATAKEPFSLKDHLFNPETIGRLAQEFGAGIPSFDGTHFESKALAGFADRELLQRLEWIADCMER